MAHSYPVVWGRVKCCSASLTSVSVALKYDTTAADERNRRAEQVHQTLRGHSISQGRYLWEPLAGECGTKGGRRARVVAFRSGGEVEFGDALAEFAVRIVPCDLASDVISRS
jgi:hypothetical protein